MDQSTMNKSSSEQDKSTVPAKKPRVSTVRVCLTDSVIIDKGYKL